MEDTNWFARLADVPKVGYPGNPGVDRRRLPGHGLQPQIDTFTFDGARHRSLSWLTTDGSTSQSPASAWSSFGDPRHTTAADVLRRVYEALELPGTATDYHFALLGAYRTLWGRFKQRAAILAELERLCLLDIVLVESWPDVLRMGVEDATFSISIPAFHYLIRLYELEGYVADALAIARRGAALRQGYDDVQRLEQRIAALRAEEAS